MFYATQSGTIGASTTENFVGLGVSAVFGQALHPNATAIIATSCTVLVFYRI
jgi:hypothetical protein